MLSLNIGDHYTMFNNENIIDSTNVAYTNKFGNENNFDVVLNYHIIPNRLVASLTYNYITYANSSSIYANPASNSYGKNQNENMFGARLQYVFF